MPSSSSTTSKKSELKTKPEDYFSLEGKSKLLLLIQYMIMIMLMNTSDKEIKHCIDNRHQNSLMIEFPKALLWLLP